MSRAAARWSECPSWADIRRAHVDDDWAGGEPVRAHLDDCPFCTGVMTRDTCLPTRPVAIEIPGFGRIDPDAQALGTGGFGEVYRATDRLLGRPVAVKVLKWERWADRSWYEHHQLFVAELRLTARLQHPGIPPVYQAGALADGRPYLAMRLVHGRTLAEILDRYRSSPNPHELRAKRGQLLDWVERVCDAADYAHRHGVAHLDLKPSNIYVGRSGQVLVLDWGLAREVVAPAAGMTRVFDSATPNRSALRNAQYGSPGYAPPEQWPGGTLSNATDYYALGGTLYYALTGRSPFALDKHDPMAYFRRHVHDPVPDFPPKLGVPRELARVVRKMLAKTPGERGTVEELLAGLQKAGGGKPPETPPRPALATPKPKSRKSAPPAADRDEPRGPIDALLSSLERLLIPGYKAGDGSGMAFGERLVALLIRPPVFVVLLLLAVALVVWWIR